VEWNNSRLAGGDLVDEIMRLKQQPGRDIALFGSANLAAALSQHGLIDEYRVLVSPVILGRGNAAFKEPGRRTHLKLLKAEAWTTGAVALFYQAPDEASR
jgi:dihydrofolate reductase